jgi:hypothetical protein
MHTTIWVEQLMKNLLMSINHNDDGIKAPLSTT